jgi:hypothetical protein
MSKWQYIEYHLKYLVTNSMPCWNALPFCRYSISISPVPSTPVFTTQNITGQVIIGAANSFRIGSTL